MPCLPKHLYQDLSIVKRHLQLMDNHSLVTEVAKMVPDFTISLNAFTNDYELLESEVTSAINEKQEINYNKMKDRIKKYDSQSNLHFSNCPFQLV